MTDTGYTRPNTESEKLIITLGWDLDEFWSTTAIASEATLREALLILEAPSEPAPDKRLEMLAAHGIEQIRKQLSERFP